MKRLPDTELEVMKALWDSGPDTPGPPWSSALAPSAGPPTPSTPTSPGWRKRVSSLPAGGGQQPVHPLVSQEDYLAFDSRAVLSRLYGSSPETSWLPWPGPGLDPGELEELQGPAG